MRRAQKCKSLFLDDNDYQPGFLCQQSTVHDSQWLLDFGIAQECAEINTTRDYTH
jgi:hypothetical protein